MTRCVYDHALEKCTGLTVLRFHSTPVNGINSSSFSGCTNLKDIYVPWAEGYFAGAPWGAPSAVVHYGTSYPAASIAMRDTSVPVTDTSFRCRDLLQALDQDGYPTGSDTMSVTWSMTALDGVTMDTATGDLTISSPESGSSVTVTATSQKYGRASATITFTERGYTLDLGDGAWVDSSTKENGYTVYKSDAGSYHVDNGTSKARITIHGYQKFVLYIRSYAESNYDYTIASKLDTAAERGGSCQQTTSGKQSQTQYYKAEYSILDNEEHVIEILYTKDSSANQGDDRGYFYIADGECQ